ncbi:MULTISPECIES: hypothetical protein [Chitinophagaceae]
MKLKLIVTIVVFFISFCICRIIFLKRQVSSNIVEFSRNIIDTIDVEKYNWGTLPLNNGGSREGKISYYISSAFMSEQENYFSFFPAGNINEILTVLSTNYYTHYVYRDIQQWIIQDKKDRSKKKYVKLPVYTLNALLLSDSSLVVKYFDHKQHENIIAVEDSLGTIGRRYEDVFPGMDDGGLSSDCSILSNDSTIFCISQYSNNVKYINRNEGQVKNLKTIEKFDNYPDVIRSRNGTVYSFKRNPFLIHPIARLIGNKIFVLSTFKNSRSQDYNHQLLFIDVYSTNLVYLYSYMMKNLTVDDVSDYCFINNRFALVNGNKFISGFCNNVNN